jgi:hypothetical protein
MDIIHELILKVRQNFGVHQSTFPPHIPYIALSKSIHLTSNPCYTLKIQVVFATVSDYEYLVGCQIAHRYTSIVMHIAQN